MPRKKKKKPTHRLVASKLLEGRQDYNEQAIGVGEMGVKGGGGPQQAGLPR